MSVTGQQAKKSVPSTPGRGKDREQRSLPPRRMWLWFIAIVIVNYLVMRLVAPGGEPSVTIPYTLFKEQVANGNVQAIYSRGDTIKGRFKTAVT